MNLETYTSVLNRTFVYFKEEMSLGETFRVSSNGYTGRAFRLDYPIPGQEHWWNPSLILLERSRLIHELYLSATTPDEGYDARLTDDYLVKYSSEIIENSPNGPREDIVYFLGQSFNGISRVLVFRDFDPSDAMQKRLIGRFYNVVMELSYDF